MRLGNNDLARIALLKVRLDVKKQPISAKAMKYRLEENSFMDTCFEKLVEYEYIEPNSYAT